MLLAQISDMHVKVPGQLLYGRIDTNAFLERAVAHLAALDPAPDAVIATGDLVDGGSPEEYRALAALLAPLAMPVYLVPGNHDRRDGLRTVFGDRPWMPADGFVQYAIEAGPLRLLGLDTLVEGKGHGALCDARLDWLEARLAESDRPTVVFMHHPPFDCGVDAFDRLKLNEGAGRMAGIVGRHRHVERVLCGHVHRSIQVRFAGTLAAVAPSTAHQAALDLHPGAPMALTMEPPGVMLHLWTPGAGLVSHTLPVGTWRGPEPFRKMQ